MALQVARRRRIVAAGRIDPRRTRDGFLMPLAVTTSPTMPIAAPEPNAARASLRRKLRPCASPILSTVIVNFRQWENTVALTDQLDSSDCMRRSSRGRADR